MHILYELICYDDMRCSCCMQCQVLDMSILAWYSVTCMINHTVSSVLLACCASSGHMVTSVLLAGPTSPGPEAVRVRFPVPPLCRLIPDVLWIGSLSWRRCWICLALSPRLPTCRWSWTWLSRTCFNLRKVLGKRISQNPSHLPNAAKRGPNPESGTALWTADIAGGPVVCLGIIQQCGLGFRLVRDHTGLADATVGGRAVHFWEAFQILRWRAKVESIVAVVEFGLIVIDWLTATSSHFQGLIDGFGCFLVVFLDCEVDARVSQVREAAWSRCFDIWFAGARRCWSHFALLQNDQNLPEFMYQKADIPRLSFSVVQHIPKSAESQHLGRPGLERFPKVPCWSWMRCARLWNGSVFTGWWCHIHQTKLVHEKTLKYQPELIQWFEQWLHLLSLDSPVPESASGDRTSKTSRLLSSESGDHVQAGKLPSTSRDAVVMLTSRCLHRAVRDDAVDEEEAVRALPVVQSWKVHFSSNPKHGKNRTKQSRAAN